MRKTIYLIAIMLMTTIAISAQEQNRNIEARKSPTAEQIAKYKAERLRKELLLGNDQYEKVYKSCLKQAREQVKRMEQVEKERKQMLSEMKDILNEAQYERYEKMQKAPHRRMRVGIHNGNMRGRGDMRRGNPKGELKPMPEIKYQARPMRGTVMEMHEEAYGDPKRNKNMYAEPKQEDKKQEKK